MSKTADDKQKRSTRTKIRCTDDELFQLHRIADEQHTTIATILRESTLDKSYDHLVLTGKKDLEDMTILVSAFDNSVKEIVYSARAAGPVFAKEAAEIEGIGRDIDKAYAALREQVDKKRERVGKTVVTILKNDASGAIFDYNDGYTTRAHSLCVSVTEDEIKAIREIADREGCSISCLLKTNAFEMYKYGRVLVQSDSVEDLNRRIQRELRFIDAILKDVKTRYMEEDDIINILSILGRLKEAFDGQQKSLLTDTASVREEAKEIIKKSKR